MNSPKYKKKTAITMFMVLIFYLLNYKKKYMFLKKIFVTAENHKKKFV